MKTATVHRSRSACFLVRNIDSGMNSKITIKYIIDGLAWATILCGHYLTPCLSEKAFECVLIKHSSAGDYYKKSESTFSSFSLY